MYFHKNRTHQLQQGLNWQTFLLQASLTLYKLAWGEKHVSNCRWKEKQKKQEVDILFRPVVRDAPVQGDAIAELSVVAVLLVFPLGVMTVLSEGGSSSPLAKATGSLNEPHGLRQACQENDTTEEQSHRCTCGCRKKGGDRWKERPRRGVTFSYSVRRLMYGSRRPSGAHPQAYIIQCHSRSWETRW